MPLRILMLNWRDMRHPEAGGAEKYLTMVASGLSARGHTVTVRTAAYPGSPAEETIDGVHYLRSGGRFDIYPRAIGAQFLRRHRPDVVVDVQNGVPYLSPLVQQAPVINLVHHVHREQWPVALGPALSRVGWWLESQVAPRVYRSSTYVTVSDATRRELIDLGIDSDRIQVIHNGTERVALEGAHRSGHPSLVVLGRLVPQKRVEFAIEAVAALHTEMPGLTLDVVGSGFWGSRLKALASTLGVADRVFFHGHVSESEKHHLLARSWVHVLPSLKEGWGLVVVEAGIHGTPTIAFTEAGGPTDSIVDGHTGMLVDGGLPEFVAAAHRLLTDAPMRTRMSGAATTWVRQFTWDETVRRWEELLTHVARGQE
ncbi:MAG: glycosyltransferase family 4 protein [Actinomycetia bacterium]|nr:glycosyltransferase family 4 protein [Actinomycetes bacterium]